MSSASVPVVSSVSEVRVQSSPVSAFSSGATQRVNATQCANQRAYPRGPCLASAVGGIVGAKTAFVARAAAAQRKGLVLLDSGASHQVVVKTPEDKRPANAQLQLAVGSVPCVSTVDDIGLPIVLVSPDYADKLTPLLPMGWFVARGFEVRWSSLGAEIMCPDGSAIELIVHEFSP